MFNENTWKDGELKTQEYMKRAGYKIIYTNFGCVGAELDVVAILPKKIQAKQLKEEFKEKIKLQQNVNIKKMYKKNLNCMLKDLNDILIITEVKARATDKYGKGVEAIDSIKMYHMRNGADFLLRKREFEGLQVRFDVASVDNGKLTYIENAFWQNKKQNYKKHLIFKISYVKLIGWKEWSSAPKS